ncbi:MAG: hypothetical protein ACKO5K_13530, partial [Armatimonadota bacterium]
MEKKQTTRNSGSRSHARLPAHRITGWTGTRAILLAVATFLGASAQAQNRTFDFEVHLDARSQLRPDLNQQRYDFFHTAELLARSNDGKRVSTQWMAQRKYFNTRLTLAEVSYQASPDASFK